MNITQINEETLLKNFETVRNLDFRKVIDKDFENWDIDSEDNYFYEPSIEKAYTFLGEPISSASFRVSKENKIEKFTVILFSEDADGFYMKMVEKYGEDTLSSVSEYYLNKYGFKKPSKYENFDETVYESLPQPTILDYKNLICVSWYLQAKEGIQDKDTIRVYNSPKNGNSFDDNERKLRIVFSVEEE